nr:uncharacterized protein LOC131277449 [Dasypus novemcinctus]
MRQPSWPRQQPRVCKPLWPRGWPSPPEPHLVQPPPRGQQDRQATAPRRSSASEDHVQNAAALCWPHTHAHARDAAGSHGPAERHSTWEGLLDAHPSSGQAGDDCSQGDILAAASREAQGSATPRPRLGNGRPRPWVLSHAIHRQHPALLPARFPAAPRQALPLGEAQSSATAPGIQKPRESSSRPGRVEAVSSLVNGSGKG